MKATAKIISIRDKRISLKRHAIWVVAYDKALAKPQSVCVDVEYGLRRRELGARRDADIAAFYAKVS